MGGKGGRCLGLTNLPPSCADCRENWEPQTTGNFKACPGIAFYLIICEVHDPKPELDPSDSIKTTSRVIALETRE
jgi:hypothetical protein